MTNCQAFYGLISPFSSLESTLLKNRLRVDSESLQHFRLTPTHSWTLVVCLYILFLIGGILWAQKVWTQSHRSERKLFTKFPLRAKVQFCQVLSTLSYINVLFMRTNHSPGLVKSFTKIFFSLLSSSVKMSCQNLGDRSHNPWYAAHHQPIGKSREVQ